MPDAEFLCAFVQPALCRNAQRIPTSVRRSGGLNERRPIDTFLWGVMSLGLLLWGILTIWRLVDASTPKGSPGISPFEARAIAGSGYFDTNVLNDQAWNIASAKDASPTDLKLAEAMAERANEMAQGRDPGILDTLACTQFRLGKPKRALELQKTAVELLKAGGETPDGERREFWDRLREYETAPPQSR